jgi:hypothetical protein
MLLRSLFSACFVEIIHPDFDLLLLSIVSHIAADMEAKKSSRL